MPSVQVYRSPQRLDRLPRKYVRRFYTASAPLAQRSFRRGGNVARLPENGQGNADLGRWPAGSRQEVRAAGSQPVFFSPRSAGRFCGPRRTWEPTGSPAHFPDPHHHYISPARHAPPEIVSPEIVSGKRIREPAAPCGRWGNRTGPKVPRSRKSSSKNDSGGGSSRSPRAAVNVGTPSRDIVSPALSPGIAPWRKTARTYFTASITRRAGMRPTLVPNRTPPFSSCPPPRKSM